MKKNKNYIITGFLILLIFSIIFIVKGIFPFGDNSIIWSDMHEQVTAIYYRFYDAVWSTDASLFVDFSSGGGVNFLGIMAYYIMSPVSLILLLFPRELVANAVSLVVVIKFLLAGLSCLYFISKYFKKIRPSYQILLSLLYAFSGYTLILYIITPWMDIVYLFPFLMIGLRKLLDLEDSKMYIIVLTMCLIFCFYISFMVLLFIIFASIIYLYVYKKDKIKHSIFNLGVSTVISILLSSVVLVPTFLQVFASQRAGFDFDVIMNSGFGPLSDKISFVFASGILVGLVFMLLLNFQKHKKFISFIFPLFVLMGLPLIIEPINKIWHFGSYVCFPYRYGFIFIFLLIVGAAYYLNSVDNKFKIPEKINKLMPKISNLLFIITVCFMIFVLYKYSDSIRSAIDSLTLTRDKKNLIFLFIPFVLVFISVLSFSFLRKNKDNTVTLFYVLAFANILFNSYLYIGNYDPENELKTQYDWMLNMNKNKGFTNGYYLKEVNRDLISNFGMVTGVSTFSNFTSLTDKVNFLTMQRLGYDSFWMDTRSLGGNLFTDLVLAQKYVISTEKYNDLYYEFMREDEGLKYYEFKYNMPYGYILKDNVSIEDSKNSFEASNLIYNAITGEENIFDIKELINHNELVEYEKDKFIEEQVKISGKKRLYLEIFSDFDNATKVNNYGAFNVYVNNELVYEAVPNDDRNGSLLLGTFEDCDVSVKIVSVEDSMVHHITLGVFDLAKLDNVIETYNTNVKVLFKDNVINVSAEGNEGDLLFLPITYIDGYVSNYEIVRVFDNFVGIKLKDGINNIKIVYYPKGIFIGLVLTIIGLVIFSIWNKLLQYVEFSTLNNIVYVIYGILYVALFVFIYVLMSLLFLKSFIF